MCVLRIIVWSPARLLISSRVSLICLGSRPAVGSSGPSTSNPATVAVPALGGRKQVRTRMVVVLPAPFGPRKPTICPFVTSKEILSTATVRAYLLVRPLTVIIDRLRLYCDASEPDSFGVRFGCLLKFHHKTSNVAISTGQLWGRVKLCHS